MTQTPALLRMKGIEKRFGPAVALAGADLEVLPGEVMGLIGQNGAGKSTLIKVLNGFIGHDSGEIVFADAPWFASSPQMAQRNGISTIFQEINLIPQASVVENIYLGRETRDALGFLSWKRMREGARALLAEFGLDIDVRAPLARYSTAIRQMVAIARAVSFDARLVIMDESTSSLDQAEVEVLFATIRTLKARGVSVIFVSHKLDELYRICDRITVMRDGRTVAVDSAANMGKLDLVATMLGRALSEVRAQGATAFSTGSGEVGAEILTVEHLAFGQRVSDASLLVRRGEIVGLAGLLGSGRTETARVIFGADARDGGTVRFRDKLASFSEPGEAIAAGMGFCSEDRKHEGIISGLSIRDNLTLALLPKLSRFGIVDKARQRKIVDRFIADLGIKCTSPEQPIGELSGGNQQKVLLARWLCMNPSLVIFDEPTRGIDVGAKAEIQKLIRRLADDGVSVLMISSEIEEILEGADRTFVLREGRTVGSFDRASATEPVLMHAMAHGDSA